MISIQSATKTSDNFLSKFKNIQFFASLDRQDLTIKEPIIYKLENEEISIVYPGKESTGWNIWDFRPVLKTNNGTTMKDLTFGEIWTSMDAFVKSIDTISTKKATVLLSRIFYKLAFLQCHKETDKDEKFCFYGDNLNISNKVLQKFSVEQLSVEEQKLFNYKVTTIDSNMNTLSISLESFIIYNDLLGCNEDSKYFYREYIQQTEKLQNKIDKKQLELSELDKSNTKKIKSIERIIQNSLTKIKTMIHPDSISSLTAEDIETKNIHWHGHIGRINTFLSYINILKFIHDDGTPYDLLHLAGRNRGVFQIDNDDTLEKFLNISTGE